MRREQSAVPRAWHDLWDAIWKLAACMGAIMLLGMAVALAPVAIALLLCVLLIRCVFVLARALVRPWTERSPFDALGLADPHRWSRAGEPIPEWSGRGAGGMKNPIVQTESGPAWVAIFGLPEK